MQKATVKFDDFLQKFPAIELPITLNDEIHLLFSKNNKPLPQSLIREFILPIEKKADELTEFVPCFSIPETINFYAIVYWKAGLMDYLYQLVTFTKQGELIDQRAIAGTFYDEEKLTKSIATIDEDWEIFVATGQSSGKTNEFDPSTSKAFKLELLPDGYITNI